MNDGLPVTPAQWDALELVVARADGQAPTYVVHHEPEGDAAIMATQAEALARRGLVTVADGSCWPTDAGRRALARQRRIEGRTS